MEDEYITNLNTDDIEDDEILEKLKRSESELIESKNQIDEKTKLYLDQKHKYEDLLIEWNNLKEEFNNQKKLIKFYEEKDSNENANEEIDPEKKDIVKQKEIEIMKLKEKLSLLE